jgi:hypothetical protein
MSSRLLPLSPHDTPHRIFVLAPHRGTGLALCVRPSVRASASAALTQALPQGVQRLGPERISSAALARPTRVAPALRRGMAPERAAPFGEPSSVTRSTALPAQRPGHAASAISSAPSERRRAGHAASAAPAARPGLIRAAQPAASEGSEGSPKRSAGSRMHERVAHDWGAARSGECELASGEQP